MKTWLRAPNQTLCGGPCQGVIPPGAPMLEIRIEGIRKLHLRCQTCAGEAPPDLPAVIQKTSIDRSKFTRAGDVTLPFELPGAQR